jgi:hypothetical protein
MATSGEQVGPMTPSDVVAGGVNTWIKTTVAVEAWVTSCAGIRVSDGWRSSRLLLGWVAFTHLLDRTVLIL